MEKKSRKIKNFYYYRSKEGVISITSNTDTWYAVPVKKKLRPIRFEVDFTVPEIKSEDDSPNIIAYKKRRGFFIPED